jgi:hypothetical protein
VAADPEVTAAITTGFKEMRSDIKEARKSGEEQTRRVHERLDIFERRTHDTLTPMGNDMVETKTTLHTHVAEDNARFGRLWWALGVAGSVFLAIGLRLVFG